jgi:hypothetical protein
VKRSRARTSAISRNSDDRCHSSSVNERFSISMTYTANARTIARAKIRTRHSSSLISNKMHLIGMQMGQSRYRLHVPGAPRAPVHRSSCAPRTPVEPHISMHAHTSRDDSVSGPGTMAWPPSTSLYPLSSSVQRRPTCAALAFCFCRILKRCQLAVVARELGGSTTSSTTSLADSDSSDSITCRCARRLRA